MVSHIRIFAPQGRTAVFGDPQLSLIRADGAAPLCRPAHLRVGQWLKGRPTSLAIALAECHARGLHTRPAESVRPSRSNRTPA
jgi:hypothetical protein